MRFNRFTKTSEATGNLKWSLVCVCARLCVLCSLNLFRGAGTSAKFSNAPEYFQFRCDHCHATERGRQKLPTLQHIRLKLSEQNIAIVARNRLKMFRTRFKRKKDAAQVFNRHSAILLTNGLSARLIAFDRNWFSGAQCTQTREYSVWVNNNSRNANSFDAPANSNVSIELAQSRVN